MDFNTVYSDRTTICIGIEKDGSITVRAPRGVNRQVLEDFVGRHRIWIQNTRKKILKKQQLQNSLDANGLTRLRLAAQQYIPGRAEQFAAIMGVSYTGIKITSAKTRFGSCSASNSLCFSLYLMCYPKSAIDAVIVHELAHIREKNHSERFYRLVEKTMPDYMQRKKLLKNGIL